MLIDIVNPAPTTEKEYHLRWKNRLTTEFVLKYGKKIKVVEK